MARTARAMKIRPLNHPESEAQLSITKYADEPVSQGP